MATTEKQRQTELRSRDTAERAPSGFAYQRQSVASVVMPGRIARYEGKVSDHKCYSVELLCGCKLDGSLALLDGVRDFSGAAQLAIGSAVAVVVSPSPEPSFIIPSSGASAAAQGTLTIHHHTSEQDYGTIGGLIGPGV